MIIQKERKILQRHAQRRECHESICMFSIICIYQQKIFSRRYSIVIFKDINIDQRHFI